jgi:GNAT superfamily N-acetyltransferase
MYTATVKDEIVIGVRAYKGQDDDGVIYNPWCHQIRKSPPFDGWEPEAFAEHKRSVIEPLVERCKPVFACDPEHEDHVYGWVCSEVAEEKQILHFVYVKGVFRNNGIGTALMKFAFPGFGKNERPLYYTHQTRAIRHLNAKWRTIWNPYLTSHRK